MIRRHWCLATILSVFFALQAFSLAYYFREQTVLAAYINHVVGSSLPPSEQIKGVVLSLKDKPDDGNDSYFLLPVFRLLRPTPWQVIEKGGDCADRSRLVIALMRLRGIQASKWALYDAQGESRHAVVQAEVESGKMVVDPLFGIWFPKPDGGYFAIPELKQDPAIVVQRISDLRAKGQRPGTDRLETYRFDQYVYSNARTINWNKSPIFRISYSILHRLLGDRVDDLRRPAFVEEPALMVVYGTAGFEVVIVLVWLVAERRRKRRTREVHPN